MGGASRSGSTSNPSLDTPLYASPDGSVTIIYELAAHLREVPGLAGLRLIAVTGYGQASDRLRTRDAGFHGHLVKPVDIDAIEATLKQASS